MYTHPYIHRRSVITLYHVPTTPTSRYHSRRTEAKEPSFADNGTKRLGPRLASTLESIGPDRLPPADPGRFGASPGPPQRASPIPARFLSSGASRGCRREAKEIRGGIEVLIGLWDTRLPER